MLAPPRKPIDPTLELLYSLQRRMGRPFNEPFGLLDLEPRDITAAWTPAVDIFEEPEVIRIVAEIPGVQAGDVRISVEGNLLTISGTKEQVAEQKAERVHRYERTYGAFERTFTLPASVDPNAIKASYDLGVLMVALPKVEKAKPRQIKVELGAAERKLPKG